MEATTQGTVLIIDDHPFVLDAMAQMVKSIGAGFEVITANLAETGLVRIQNIENLRLIILDYNLPSVSGCSAINMFRQEFPNTPIFVISGLEDREVILAAQHAGASAYISKSLSSDTVRNIIKKALLEGLDEGQRITQPSILGGIESLDKLLTARQLDVLGLLLKGYPNKDIAFHTNLANATVKSHVSGILRVLGVANRTQAVMAIQRMGLTENTSKQEDTKQEDTKQEDTKQEDTKQEDTKQEDIPPPS